MAEPVSPMADDERPADPAERRVAVLVAQAGRSLLWERLWPRLALSLGILALFVAVSWLGLWLAIGPWPRLAVLVAFAAAFLVSLVLALRTRQPSRAEAVHRIEAVSGLPHRPLTALEDKPAANLGPAATALWEAHRRRAIERLAALAPGFPRPALYRHDPWALRALVGMALFVGLFAGYGSYGERLESAFRPFGPLGEAKPIRLDAWITPPGYTGRAPIFLTGDAAAATDHIVKVPSGSELVVRVHGAPDAAVTFADAKGERPLQPPPAAKPEDGKDAGKDGDKPPANTAATAPDQVERKAKLTGDGTVKVTNGGDELARWSLAVEPDHPPTIKWLADPVGTRGGGVEFAYEVKDDYGIVDAEARITPMPSAGDDAGRRPLVDAPKVRLSLPAGGKAGAAKTVADLTKHPYAGSTVAVVLVARDEAGHEAVTPPVTITLPERPFREPLARAVIEQRRDLALDARSQQKAIASLDALMLAPDGIFPTTTSYLGTRLAYQHLAAATTDEHLKPILDELWDLAIAIDDGSHAAAAQALRDAQERLKQAIRNGASDEEIARLTDELRQAMQNYLRDLAEEMRRNPQAPQQGDQNARTVTPKDLDEMLRKAEELARTGSPEAAEQLLSELQQMLEGLQMARPGQPGQQGQGSEQSQQLDKLGRMIQEQQRLMDETYNLDRQNPDNGDGSQSGGDRQQRLKQLQDRQDALNRDLQDMMKRLGPGQQGQGQNQGQNGRGDQKGQPGPGQGESGQGDPGQSAQGQGGQGQSGQGGTGNPGDALGDAGRAMGEAGNALGRGESGDAVDRQGEALEALRKGAQSLAEQMARENGDEQGAPGEGGTASGDEDPLGRSSRSRGTDFGSSVKVPDAIDIQRARRILDELRRRLGELGRSQLELDYLERLLPRD